MNVNNLHLPVTLWQIAPTQKDHFPVSATLVTQEMAKSVVQMSMNVASHHQYAINMQNVQMQLDPILANVNRDFLEMVFNIVQISMNVYPNLASAISSLIAAMLQGPIHVIVGQDFLGMAN